MSKAIFGPLSVGILVLSLGGCAVFQSGLRINHLNLTLNELKYRAKTALPLGVGHISKNDREFESKFFAVKDGHVVPSDHARVRFYGKITILGTERPYNLSVQVYRQRLVNDGGRLVYSDAGTDLRIAKWLRHRVQLELAKRREDINIIDDFRVF